MPRHDAAAAHPATRPTTTELDPAQPIVTLTVGQLGELIDQRIAQSRPPSTGGVSVREAAQRLGVSERSAWRLVASQRLRSRKVGSRTVVMVESVDALLGEVSP